MTRKLKALALGGFALSVLGGGIGGAMAATAAGATTIALAASNSPTPSGAGTTPPPNMPAPGTSAHENAETVVTGADATKAQAAAVKAAGGGTAGTVTTDFIKNGYEVTVTKSDGTKVEIHLDSSFNVMPRPGPGGPGGLGRPNDNDTDDTGSPSTGG